MTGKNISDIRLQELMVFHAILSNGSITTAAEALGVTQSTVSKRLKRLRDYFGDELFVRSGRGMAATNKALVISEQVSNLINSFEALSGEIRFDPGDVRRDFVVSTSDEIQHALMPDLTQRISARSPKSRVIFKVLERDYAAKQLESGSVDVAITLDWHAPNHFMQRRLFSDDFAILYREGHPLAARKLTLQQYLSASHMMISPLGTMIGPVDEILAASGHKRKVTLATPYFMQVAGVLTSSDLILTLQRRACEELVKQYPLAIAELPIAMRPINYHIFWHKRYDKDSTNRWFRQVCCDILQAQADSTTTSES